MACDGRGLATIPLITYREVNKVPVAHPAHKLAQMNAGHMGFGVTAIGVRVGSIVIARDIRSKSQFFTIIITPTALMRNLIDESPIAENIERLEY